MQVKIEEYYSKKKLRSMMKKFIIENVEPEEVTHGVELLNDWLSVDYYPSKNMRLTHVKSLDLEKIVVDIIAGTLAFSEDTLLTNAVGQLAGLLKMDNKLHAIMTMSEILAILCDLDFYDLNKSDDFDSWSIQSKVEIPEEILDQQIRSMYLPPMIEPPKALRSNKDSGYFTVKESLILGSGNHHDGDICLDVLNLMASVPLKLDMDFIRGNRENPNEEITADLVLAENPWMTDEEAIAEAEFRIAMFDGFRDQSQEIYTLVSSNGNKFYLNQKVDKRGRVYAQGYHVSTAGASYKKASIELFNEEIVEGI